MKKTIIIVGFLALSASVLWMIQTTPTHSLVEVGPQPQRNIDAEAAAAGLQSFSAQLEEENAGRKSLADDFSTDEEREKWLAQFTQNRDFKFAVKTENGISTLTLEPSSVDDDYSDKSGAFEMDEWDNYNNALADQINGGQNGDLTTQEKAALERWKNQTRETNEASDGT